MPLGLWLAIGLGADKPEYCKLDIAQAGVNLLGLHNADKENASEWLVVLLFGNSRRHQTDYKRQGDP